MTKQWDLNIRRTRNEWAARCVRAYVSSKRLFACSSPSHKSISKTRKHFSCFSSSAKLRDRHTHAHRAQTDGLLSNCFCFVSLFFDILLFFWTHILRLLVHFHSICVLKKIYSVHRSTDLPRLVVLFAFGFNHFHVLVLVFHFTSLPIFIHLQTTFVLPCDEKRVSEWVDALHMFASEQLIAANMKVIAWKRFNILLFVLSFPFAVRRPFLFSI